MIVPSRSLPDAVVDRLSDLLAAAIVKNVRAGLANHPLERTPALSGDATVTLMKERRRAGSDPA